jgi:hypothetical protein
MFFKCTLYNISDAYDDSYVKTGRRCRNRKFERMGAEKAALKRELLTAEQLSAADRSERFSLT